MQEPTLTGELVLLRPLTESDVAEFRHVLEDPEGRRLSPVPDLSDEMIRAQIRRAHDDPGRIELVVTPVEGENFLGWVVLHSIDPISKSAQLHMVMHPSYRSRGYGTESVELVLKLAFEQMQMHRVGLEVPAANGRAQSMYENIGFQVEGRMRDAHRNGEGWCDAVVMGLLDEEYRDRIVV